MSIVKKILKHFLISLICISLFVSTSTNAVCVEEPLNVLDINGNNSNISQIRKDQKGALRAFFILKQYFQFDDTGNISSYPNNYGGTYINEKNELVLRVTEYDEWVRSIVQGIEEQGETVIIELCRASLITVVAEYLETKEFLPQEIINCSYYSSSLNSYVLRCYQENEDDLSEALSVLGTEFIIIQVDEKTDYCNHEQSGDTPLRTSYLYGGILLYYGQSPIGTLGISGSYSKNNVTNNHCYLTAGHVAYNRTVGPTSSTTSQYSPIYCQYQDGGTGDYAVVPAPTSYSKSNQVYTSNSLARTSVTKYYSSVAYPEGAVVYKFGQATLLTYGNVVGDSYTGYVDWFNSNYQLYGMIAVNHSPYISAPGDSGGPCWVYNDQDEIVLLGTVSGGSYPTWQTTYSTTMYVSTICYAVSGGFTPYNMSAVTSIY